MLDMSRHCPAGRRAGDAVCLPSPSSRTVLGPVAAPVCGLQVMQYPTMRCMIAISSIVALRPPSQARLGAA